MAAAQPLESETLEIPDTVPPDAPPATQRVLAGLYREAIPYTLKLLPPEIRGPEAIAEHCDCDINFIALCTVYRGKATKKPVLLVHSAASTLNEKVLAQIVGENLTRADSVFVERLTGYAQECVPPLALLNRVPVMLDASVMRFARIWVPGGSPEAIVSVPTMVLARAISARIVRLDA